MNFLQLCQRTVLECGVSGGGPSTTVNQTGQLLRIVSWVNSAWIDIQSIHQDWQWLRNTCAFPTVTGQATYTPAQCNATDFGMWARDTLRNYSNPVVTLSIASPCVATCLSHGLSTGDTVMFLTEGSLPTGVNPNQTYYIVSVPSVDTFTFSATESGAAVNSSGTQSGTITLTSNNTTEFSGLRSEIFMEYLEYESWRNLYQYGNLRFTETRPIETTITPNKSIGLGPVPISGYTVLGDYYKVPTEMSANTDVPALPTQFHMAIVYRAMMFYGGYEGAPDVFQRGQIEFNKILSRMEIDRLPDVLFCGPLA